MAAPRSLQRVVRADASASLPERQGIAPVTMIVVTAPQVAAMERLLKRKDFLKVQKGRRASTGLFSLELLLRQDEQNSRVGFTVSKKVSMSAVVRNRIRRRLKEAMKLEAGGLPATNHDLVVVARRASLTVPFKEMRGSLAATLEKLTKTRQSPAGSPSSPTP
jgi:ribonuclease P protein component